MKLHLLILASLFPLSSGFMAELRGPITEEECSGEEYADFKRCVEEGLAQDGENLTEIEEEAFVNHGNEENRQLVNWCSGCTGGAPKAGMLPTSEFPASVTASLSKTINSCVWHPQPNPRLCPRETHPVEL
jgi:hypothetical protein